jgi:hypothetical protein
MGAPRSLRVTREHHAIVLAASALLFTTASAHAEETPLPDARIDLNKDVKPAPPEGLLPAPPEAPPPAPYKKTLVLDASVGALGFLGRFGEVAPPAPWMHAQLGYEIFRWLMIYGEGELAFTDTSHRQSPPNTRAFAMFGFGGGARFTVRFTERVGAFAQAGVGLMKADVPENALGILGFKDAESLGLYLGGRLGVEWYQLDRHLALGLNGGMRTAQGFARVRGSDSPLAIDGGVSLRYAF